LGWRGLRMRAAWLSNWWCVDRAECRDSDGEYDDRAEDDRGEDAVRRVQPQTERDLRESTQ